MSVSLIGLIALTFSSKAQTITVSGCSNPIPGEYTLFATTGGRNEYRANRFFDIAKGPQKIRWNQTANDGQGRWEITVMIEAGFLIEQVVAYNNTSSSPNPSCDNWVSASSYVCAGAITLSGACGQGPAPDPNDPIGITNPSPCLGTVYNGAGALTRTTGGSCPAGTLVWFQQSGITPVSFPLTINGTISLVAKCRLNASTFSNGVPVSVIVTPAPFLNSNVFMTINHNLPAYEQTALPTQSIAACAENSGPAPLALTASCSIGATAFWQRRVETEEGSNQYGNWSSENTPTPTAQPTNGLKYQYRVRCKTENGCAGIWTEPGTILLNRRPRVPSAVRLQPNAICKDVSPVPFSSSASCANTEELRWYLGYNRIEFPTTTPESDRQYQAVCFNISTGCESNRVPVNFYTIRVDGGQIGGSSTIISGQNPEAFSSNPSPSYEFLGDYYDFPMPNDLVNFTLQWRRMTNPGNSFGNISGATQLIFDESVLTRNQATLYTYRRKATARLGTTSCTAFSNNVTIQVNPDNAAARAGIEEETNGVMVIDGLSHDNWAVVSPNPVSNNIHLYMYGEPGETVSLDVINVQGKSLFQRQISLKRKISEESFDLFKTIPEKEIFLRLQKNSQRLTIKLLINK